MPGRGTQESGEGPGATWDGESRPESSTFSGDEEEKGEGLEVKPRLLEPGGGGGGASSRPRPHGGPVLPPAGHAHSKPRPPLRPRPLAPSFSAEAPPVHPRSPTLLQRPRLLGGPAHSRCGPAHHPIDQSIFSVTRTGPPNAPSSLAHPPTYPCNGPTQPPASQACAPEAPTPITCKVFVVKGRL